ncbi:MAG TPA: prepilin-type N-terminal cleavage/methylation domain-containing protein [Acidiferrobacteraceae bacterium]|nr:prepilin-type N-terminal cleavage/methylation domain-containing protein [Acidiferrobacteraceae bacterium]HEX20317.1 prepilin-type N-terminal cleavage/methylation domain-containing protein [Acidiferrobacteraceae bacterium]
MKPGMFIHPPQKMLRQATVISRQQGFSLVELMVALVLGLIIMAGVIAVFSSVRNTQQTDTGLTRIQENARFAINIISKEARSAGYLGCLRDLTQFQSALKNAATFQYNFGVGIEGFEADNTQPGAAIVNLATTVSTWTPTLDANIPSSGNTVPGSDVLVIRRISNEGYRLLPNYVSDAKTFSEPGTELNYKTGDILVVTDCERATVFQATNVTLAGGQVGIDHSLAAATPGNRCDVWGSAGCVALPTYGAGAEISRASTVVFYVRQNPGDALPALYMARFGQGAGVLSGLRLVDGVESMQIVYGVDTTPSVINRAERYMTAAQIATDVNIDWSQVVSVRVSLLMRTVNEPGEQADQTADVKVSYALAGTPVKPPSDQNRRRVFTTTIQLRNRIKAGVE